MTDGPATGERVREALAGKRFADVRWVDETGSTNADVVALARAGEAEGIVCVADHQSAGRGRRGRTWAAPPGASLLFTVLFRPPANVAQAVPMLTAVATTEAIETVAGFSPRLKWPNDLVWPGDGRGSDRKLAGMLAEADWSVAGTVTGGRAEPTPTERAVVAVGIGLNVNWPAPLPSDLADVAVAINGVAGHNVDRGQLLVAILDRLDHHYDRLLTDGEPSAIHAQWRARSATLGRRVRIDLGSSEMVEGLATDITAEGHLVVETDARGNRVLAVGDVIHLRTADQPFDAGSSELS